MYKEQEIFGLPVIVTDAVPEGTVLVGSWPEPEHPDMTLDEYAVQCGRHFVKLKLDSDERPSATPET